MQHTVTRTATSNKWLRFLALVALVLLVIEFLFGMLVNLYVSIPSPLPGTTPSTSGNVLHGLVWSLEQTGLPTLLLHVVVGLLLVLVSLALLVLSLVARRGPWLAVSLIAIGGTIIATLGGSYFVETGGLGSSLVMSIGFLTALIAYAVGLYVTRSKGQPS
jgi:hypothetical protein